jgi:hypothetical protein
MILRNYFKERQRGKNTVFKRFNPFYGTERIWKIEPVLNSLINCVMLSRLCNQSLFLGAFLKIRDHIIASAIRINIVNSAQ